MHPYYRHIHGRAHTKGFVNEACTAYIAHLMCMYIHIQHVWRVRTDCDTSSSADSHADFFLCFHFIAIYIYIYIYTVQVAIYPTNLNK